MTKAVTAICVLGVGVWFFVNPLAGAAALVALGMVLLLVGVPLAVIRGVLRVRAVLASRERDRAESIPRARRDTDADVAEPGESTAPAE